MRVFFAVIDKSNRIYYTKYTERRFFKLKLTDRFGREITVVPYDRRMDKAVKALYLEGYPDSFDEHDIESIDSFLEELEDPCPKSFLSDGLECANVLGEDRGCLVAARGWEILGSLQYYKVKGSQDLYMLSYIYTREKCRKQGIGGILIRFLEEILKDKARILYTVNPGIFPDYGTSYGFFGTMGYQEWGELPGYFRDDLSGIFFVKRNPNYVVGKGIPENSGWCKEMADSRTGRRISNCQYQKILYLLQQSKKWGV